MSHLSNVLEYSDYRSFLVNYSRHSKRQNRYWSQRVWARQLGIKSSSTLAKILVGKREPGPDLMDRLITYFKFNDQESLYFQQLVLLSKYRNNPPLAMTILKQLKDVSPNNDFTQLNEEEFAAISKWWFYAIRQMTKLKTFNWDPKWIASELRFKVTPGQVKKAIATMIKLKLIRISENNILVPVNKSLRTKTSIGHEAINQYHESMMENAKVAIRKINFKERAFSSLTFCIDIQRLADAIQSLREFRDQFNHKFGIIHGDSVYQLQIQLFPLTKISKDKGVIDEALVE